MYSNPALLENVRARFVRCGFTTNTASIGLGGALSILSPAVNLYLYINASYVDYDGEADLNVVNCSFVGNSAPGVGTAGAILAYSNLFVAGSTFVNNTARPAVFNAYTSAITGGGAIFAYYAFAVHNSTFEGNYGNRGGALNVGSWPFTVSQCVFRNNVAGLGGASAL